METEQKGYKIRSQLVSEALFGWSNCPALRGSKRLLPNCTGYTYSDRGHIGKAVLTLYFSKIFNIHRACGFEDGFLKGSNAARIRREFSVLTADDTNGAENEFERLYEFTQEYLKSCTKVENQCIEVVRALRDFEIDQIVDQLNDRKEEVVLQTNTITSYAADKRLFHYGSCMSIVRIVPIKDVVIYYAALEYPKEVNSPRPSHGGEYEVWVKNEHPLGHLKLQREQIKIDQDRYNKYLKKDRSSMFYHHIL